MSHLLQLRDGGLLQPVKVPARCVIAAAAKKQKPKRRKPKQPVSERISYTEDDFDEEYDEEGPANIRLMPGSRIPKAPAPKAAPASAAPEPEDLYPVFPKQPKAVERLPDSKWSWGDDGPGAGAAAAQQQPAARMWNPRTGFMRTRAEQEQEQEQQQAAAAAGPSASTAGVQPSTPQPALPGSRSASSTSSSSSSSSSDARSSSSSSSSSSRVVERIQDSPNPLQPPQLPPSALGGAAAAAVQAAPGQLPAAGRAQVLTSCALTAAAMSAAALALSLLAAKQSAVLFGTSQETVDRLLQLPPGLQDVQQLGVMLAAAAAVTGARFVLKQQWGEFREATDRSNRQVLSSLGWPDVVLVALLSAVSEELLFRWALISGTWPDARGVLLSGAVFGVLHISGGRNGAFAAWAAAVGWLYGAAFLATGNVWVPAGAHALANFASAAVWIASNKGQDGSQQQEQP